MILANLANIYLWDGSNYQIKVFCGEIKLPIFLSLSTVLL